MFRKPCTGRNDRVGRQIEEEEEEEGRQIEEKEYLSEIFVHSMNKLRKLNKAKKDQITKT